MKFLPEELIPLVSELTDRYTQGESTSITYEKANQLMQAVLYCIEEYERPCGEADMPALPDISAAEAYQAGYEKVIRRTKAAGESYSKLIPAFKDYGNRAYRETVARGLPVFFKKYDARFAPQEHFLTLDYPVIRSFGNSCGIDLISDYIDCIAREQEFLRKIPEAYVTMSLNRWRGDYAELFMNVAGFTARNLLAAMMIGKENLFEAYAERERSGLKDLLLAESAESLKHRLKQNLQRLISEQYGGSTALFAYLSADLAGFVTDLKNAAAHNCLEAVISL